MALVTRVARFCGPIRTKWSEFVSQNSDHFFSPQFFFLHYIEKWKKGEAPLGKFSQKRKVSGWFLSTAKKLFLGGAKGKKDRIQTSFRTNFQIQTTFRPKSKFGPKFGHFFFFGPEFFWSELINQFGPFLSKMSDNSDIWQPWAKAEKTSPFSFHHHFLFLMDKKIWSERKAIMNPILSSIVHCKNYTFFL